MLTTAAAALLLPVVSAFSTSTTYCRDGDNFSWGCPTEAAWPENLCTTDSGAALCKCPEASTLNNYCVIDNIASSYTSGRCAENLVRVTSATPIMSFPGDSAAGTGFDSTDTDAGIEETVYCKKMIRNDGWAQYTRGGSGDSDPEYQIGANMNWWDWMSCSRWGWWGRTWHNGNCYDNDRYLGEFCSDDLACKGAGSYEEYDTACTGEGKCAMYAVSIQRPQCECNWFDWWIWFACASDTCNGHACVLTTRDMNYYCDWATEQGSPLAWFR